MKNRTFIKISLIPGQYLISGEKYQLQDKIWVGRFKYMGLEGCGVTFARLNASVHRAL